MNAESMKSIDIYNPAEYLLDVGFENIYNSYSNEFPEIVRIIPKIYYRILFSRK